MATPSSGSTAGRGVIGRWRGWARAADRRASDGATRNAASALDLRVPAATDLLVVVEQLEALELRVPS